MPKIPQQERGSFISTSMGSPQMDFRHAGQVEKEFGQLGDQLMNIGSDIIQKRERAKAVTYEASSILQMERNFNVFDTKLKATLGPEAKGYAEAVNDWFSLEQDKFIENAPNQMGKEAFLNSATKLKGNALIDADSYTHKTHAANFLTSMKTQSTDEMNHQLSFPNPERVMNSAVVIGKQRVAGQEEGLYTQAEGEADFQTHTNRMAMGMFMGMDNSDKLLDAGLKEAQNMKGPAQFLTPEQRDQWIERFKARKKDVSAMRAREFNERMNSLNSGILTGDYSLEKIESETKLLENEARTNESMKGFVGDKLIDEIAMIKQLATVAHEFRADSSKDSWMKSATKMANMKSNFPDNKANALAKMKDVLQNKVKQIEDNPPPYFIRDNPTVREAHTKAGAAEAYYKEALASGNEEAIGQAHGAMIESRKNAFSTMISAQRAWGIPENKIRIADESQVHDMANELRSNDPVKIRQAINSLASGYGDYSKRAFAEVAEFGAETDAEQKKFGQMLVASYVPDPIVQRQMITGAMNDEPINTSFKANYDMSDTDLDAYISSNATFSKFQKAAGGSSKFVNNIRDAVRTNTKVQMNTNGTPAQHSTAIAVDKILAKNFDSIEEGRSSLMVPKNIPSYNKSIVSAWFEHHSTEQGFRDLGIKEESRFHLGQLEDEAKWTQDESGLNFHLTRNIDGDEQILYNKDGKSISVSLKDILDTKNPTVLEEAKPFGEDQRIGFENFMANQMREAAKSVDMMSQGPSDKGFAAVYQKSYPGRSVEQIAKDEETTKYIKAEFQKTKDIINAPRTTIADSYRSAMPGRSEEQAARDEAIGNAIANIGDTFSRDFMQAVNNSLPQGQDMSASEIKEYLADKKRKDKKDKSGKAER